VLSLTRKTTIKVLVEDDIWLVVIIPGKKKEAEASFLKKLNPEI